MVRGLARWTLAAIGGPGCSRIESAWQSSRVSQAASQAAAFYRDVARNRKVWTIRDDQGFPAPKTTNESRAQPFWSSLARAERIVATVPAYKGFVPVEIPWVEFRDRWLAALERDGLKVGLNWSGSKAIGYDLTPGGVRQSIEAVAEREQQDALQPPSLITESFLPPPEWFDEFRLLHIDYGRRYNEIRQRNLPEAAKRNLTFAVWLETDEHRKRLMKHAVKGLRCTAVKPNGERCSRPARPDYIGQMCSSHAPHVNLYPGLDETRRIWRARIANWSER